MAKSFALLSSVSQRFALAATLATLTVSGGSAALADDGNFRTGTCGTGAANFIELTNGQATYGFNNQAQAAQLSQSGSGSAGLTLNFKYTTAQPTTANDFRILEINFNDGENKAARKTVTVKYCFQGDHGDGRIVEYTTTLNRLDASSVGNGFRRAQQNAMQFGGLNVRNLVLRKLTFIVEDDQPSNITIGDVELNTASTSFHPDNINMNPVSCNNLYDCPNANPAPPPSVRR